MDFNSREDLQKELKKVDKDIQKAEIRLSTLHVYRETIASKLSELTESKRRIVNIGEFDNAIDPVKACLNSLEDSDEIRIEDVAYMLGISTAVLLTKIDTNQLRVFKYSNKRNSRTGKVLTVEYIKKLLEDNDNGDIEKRKFVEDVFREYYENAISLSIKSRVKDLLYKPSERSEYEDLTLKQLIIGGYNRGFIKFTHYNTMLKMLDSFNCKYTLDYSSYRVMENSTNRFIKVYSK
jgi:hypothetical protein